MIIDDPRIVAVDKMGRRVSETTGQLAPDMGCWIGNFHFFFCLRQRHEVFQMPLTSGSKKSRLRRGNFGDCGFHDAR